MTNKEFLQTKGKIIQSLGNNTFRLELENKKKILATVASRFRTSTGKRKAKLVEGDMVWLEIPADDLSKGRIISFVAEKHYK
jgi:translation initiation factor IF-1